uniref:Uncharacterized protein n=1 Tax=Craspedostauros australis TaxID=1486917 RepID=A0A7R9ZJP0_9STRA|mmetsp:Transcript_11303/g.31274  ORF Transcript_11303/g.31274 Transcript_11303/m.31274 type:complete len:108 (+) Transcript_11303:124-447(+)
MGNLVVAMPRSNFRGAFSTSSANDLPSSSLIGTDSSEDHILASQMASRLAKRSGRAVFVSCNLMTGGDGLADAGSSDAWMMGLSQDLVAQRAAAIAEKEIWTILSQG